MLDHAKAVDLTARMHSMRDSMRFIWGEQYEEKVVPWQSTIANVAAARHVKLLQAAIKLVIAAKDNNFVVMAVMAAYLEMIEHGGVPQPKPQGIAA